jgi:pimeloyl-ACP methyl ester carboxylesterase
MSQIQANGINIEYETFGHESDRPLLLVMGLGGQLIHWDSEFCTQLAEKGHYVIRYDNRDAGLSEKMGEFSIPDMAQMMADFLEGETPEVPYTLNDMAEDGMALLTGLGIQQSHICGASLGGMIVQAMAINFPDRVKSMTSIMSTTGNSNLPPASPEAQAALLSPAGENEAEIVQNAIEVNKIIGSPGFEFDLERTTQMALEAFERSFYPEGIARQMAAVAAGGDRREKLNQLATPTLVIHGTDDCLVPVEGGIDTHNNIQGSELMLIEGMGHNLPVGAWSQIIKGVTQLTSNNP